VTLSQDVQKGVEIVGAFGPGLCRSEEYLQLLIVDAREVLLQQIAHEVLGSLEVHCATLASAVQLGFQQLSVPCNERSNGLSFSRIFPGGKGRGSDGKRLASLGNTAESLLPLVQIDNAVFSNIDSVKKILDYSISGLRLTGQSVKFYRKLSKVFVTKSLRAALIELKMR